MLLFSFVNKWKRSLWEKNLSRGKRIIRLPRKQKKHDVQAKINVDWKNVYKKKKKKCLCLQIKNFPVWCLDASKHLKNVRATRNQYLVYFIKSVATHQEEVPTSLLPTSCLKQTIPFQIFYRLSSTNLTWSILEYFVPYTNLILI